MKHNTTPLTAAWAENLRNMKRRRSNVSGFKGVHFEKKSGRFRAIIKVNGRTKQLGGFDTAEAAHARYCEAAKQHFGEFARLEP